MEGKTAPQSLPPIAATRRGFIKWLLGFSVVSTAGGVLVPVVGYLWPPGRKGAGYTGPTMVATLSDLPIGTGKVFPVDNKPVIVVNTAEGGVRAFSAICTHLGCVVDWNKNKNFIQSPCHDGRFNATTGAVISGPPPRGLPPYEVSVKDGKIFIGKPLGQIYGA